MDHFTQRCLERGIMQTDLRTLKHGICWAIVNQRDDLVEQVLKTGSNIFWRFRCPDGIFYTVTDDGDPTPKTILTQAMMRKKKWAHKKRKRGTARG